MKWCTVLPDPENIFDGTCGSWKQSYTERVRRILLTLAISLQLSAGVSPDFAQRRDKLRNEIPNGIAILFGEKEAPEELHYAFFQEPNFLYLTGWEEPGAIVVLTPNPDKDSPKLSEESKQPREILFLPDRDLRWERWTGRKLGPLDPDVKEKTGFSLVLPVSKFESTIRNLMDVYPNFYALAKTPGAEMLSKLAPLRETTDLRRTIGRLRQVKSAEEISKIQKTTDASVKGHLAAWKMISAGKYEYEVAAAMVGEYMKEGCQRSAYSPIVGSGLNSTVLHYSKNSRRMDSGEVTVMDVAAECDNYASDITRTVPVNGKFSKRQREIYEIVLGAQQAAMDAIKPGVPMSKLTQIARDYIKTHGKDLHGEPLDKYFIHGLGHPVGLDVHDPTDPQLVLKENMVITIEPGIYIPEESLGVRIEDTILVTKDGYKNMSGALPRDPNEIERALARRN